MFKKLWLGILGAVLLFGASSSTWAQVPNTSNILQNAAGATGNGNSLATSGFTQTALQISGTFVGTIVPEGSLDGSNFNTLTCWTLAGSSVTSMTSTGLWRCNTIGVQQIRARISAWTSGSITVVASATPTTGPVVDQQNVNTSNAFTSPTITTGLNDANGNQEIGFTATGTAVNNLNVANAATGNGPVLSAIGETNVDITLKGKGTGSVILGQATSTGVKLAADQPINDSSGNELIKFVKTASAVNEITITNNSTGVGPIISATGETNVDLTVNAKGTGVVKVVGGGTNAVRISTTQTTAPTLGTCGTSPSIVGTDVNGIITVGTSTPAACTLTFNGTWANAPACVVQNQTTAASYIQKAATTTTTIVITPAANFGNNDILSYVCLGRH